MIGGVDDTTVLGLAGIISSVLIAAFGYWYNYATRSQPHREFLYQKQIEAYLELSTILSKLLRPCYEYLVTKRNLTPEDKSEYSKITSAVFLDVVQQAPIARMMLPNDVNEKIGTLLSVLTEGYYGQRGLPDNATEVLLTLTEAEFGIYDAIRKNAGIDPLTQQMRQVFGQVRSSTTEAAG